VNQAIGHLVGVATAIAQLLIVGFGFVFVLGLLL